MQNSLESIEQIADSTKREFIKKFGGYAASAPLTGFILMAPGSSIAHAASCSTCPPYASRREQRQIFKNQRQDLRNKKASFKADGTWSENKVAWKAEKQEWKAAKKEWKNSL